MADAPARHIITEHTDTRRWRNIVRRPDDIVASAPSLDVTDNPGFGWFRHVLMTLVWSYGESAATQNVSPWIEDRAMPIEDLVVLVDAQKHRRLLMTTSPGDCFPFDKHCRYVSFYGANVWQASDTHIDHLAGWWPRRHESNVLFVHQTDLLSRRDVEVERIASFLDVEVPAELPAQPLIDEAGPLVAAPDLLLERVPEDAARWFAHGSKLSGIDPRGAGVPAAPVQTASGHLLRRLGGANGRSARTGAVQEISERRIEIAREDGLFDNLAGSGKPLPDIDQHRPAGWWAKRFVQTERNKVKALQLEAEIRKAMPGLWRLETEQQMRDELDRVNTRIVAYNEATTVAPMKLLNVAETLQTWNRLRQT